MKQIDLEMDLKYPKNKKNRNVKIVWFIQIIILNFALPTDTEAVAQLV